MRFLKILKGFRKGYGKNIHAVQKYFPEIKKNIPGLVDTFTIPIKCSRGSKKC